jgi:mono/diheme cytochrome c family protein
MMQMLGKMSWQAGWMLPALVLTACNSGAPAPAAPAASGPVAYAAPKTAADSSAQVLAGRQVVITHDCSGCHGGSDPAAKGWLAGVMSPQQEFYIGPCSVPNPKAKPCFITRPRNLTPDNATGLGRFTERQIFNALRYGLRPEDTPDVEITSTAPGQGNFPATPHYLAPPMPWNAWRHMTDQELWAIAAYLKRGLAPVVNKVAESEGPPDFWAGAYADSSIGKYPSPAFPTANEHKP